MKNFIAALNRPIDAASLSAFRWMFGWLMCIDVLRYLRFGWVSEYYIEPPFHFTYWGFEWVRPWPGIGMYVHFVVLALCAAAIATGFFYRIASVLFTVGFSYVFLLEKAHYLNHFYVIILISTLISTMPANRLWSADAKAGRVQASEWIPAWPVYLLRTQLVIIYVYAGIAKLNGDWLQGRPLDMWLNEHQDVPLIGPFLAGDTFSMVASYAGLFIDLVLGPALLFRKTRVAALIMMASFHLANSLLFSIGIFPWMMLGANLLFLDPDWPRHLPKMFDRLLNPKDMKRTTEQPATVRGLRVVGLTAIGAWLSVQLLLPLRHHMYPGNVNWTEQGHRYSWRMKLRDKRGPVTFYVESEDGKRRKVDHREELTKRQTFKMACTPDMILEYAHHLADKVEAEGRKRPRVFARAKCSLNGHPSEHLIDRDVDLAAVEDDLKPASWILLRKGGQQETLEVAKSTAAKSTAAESTASTE